ncbi:cytochrome c oxidase assembly protein [Sinorhizobium sp. RAC02]|uniref:cytochrome c oxidase assembly protein n=1 Tax=Sinorhizobium sp. RAC02 TaxID=1842534 RepID=UPI00083E19CF|nr:cytochrome c oxidase assembly protein [Sinorhizobium sp. RAC02]AOF93566.1 cytochrome c oxidase caa3 assembly factor family protein [Sinorhizobium sp. RAC02]
MTCIARLLGPVLLAVLGALFLASFGGGSFAAHMVIHMGIVAVAAPLIAYGLRDTRLDPLPGTLRVSPMLASFIELVVVWFWHLPAFRASADASLILSLVEQSSFLVAGVLLWHACFRPKDGRLAGTAGLLFTSMHMTLLGVLLALAPRPLYGDGDGDITCFGIPLSAAADQQIGGVVMLMAGALAYLLGGILLLAGVLRDGETVRERARW